MKFVIRIIVATVALGGIVSSASTPVRVASPGLSQVFSDTPCWCPFPDDWPANVN